MNTRRFLLLSLSFMTCSLTAVAQTETPAAAAPPEAAAPAVTVAGSDPVAAPVTRDKDTLSVDFPDEDIKTILRNVADLFELNLVVPDTLVGKTSIKLRDVSWRQIFQVVLSPVGYTYIEEGNIIKIVSNELMAQEPGATEVFILNNAKAADIKPTIDGLIDAAKGGKIVVDNRSNSLVITERPTQLKRIANIIEQLDKATDQVMIESKFVEVTDRDIRNIGVNWASLQGMNISASGIKQDFSKGRTQAEQSGFTQVNSNGNGTTASNTVTNTIGSASGTNAVTGNTVTNGTFNNSTTNNIGGTTTGGTNNTGGLNTSNTQSNTGNQLLPQTTTDPFGNVTTTYVVSPINSNSTTTGSVLPTSQTNTSTTLPSSQTTSSSGTTGGTSSNSASGTTASTGNDLVNSITNGLTSSVNNAIQSLTGLANTGSTARMATAVFSSTDFNIIVSALKQQNNTKIVSNPTIVTLNNTEATINIGQEFPVPSYTYNSERGSFEVSGFTYKPIGIILKVTPQVNARGIIKMSLEPEVSQQNGSTSFGGAGGAQIPIVATRKVKTQVSLKDGYTMGIGGLITTSMDHGGTKVPILGDIPVLGRLFSSKNVNDVATNLLIFITAKTVSADGASPEEVFDPRAVQAVGLSREDLPGYRAPKGTDLYAAPVNAKP